MIRRLFRSKNIISTILCLSLTVGTLSMSGCSLVQNPITKSGTYFGTLISITVYDKNDVRSLNECFEIATQYQNILDSGIETSDLYRLNHAGGEPVAVSDEFIALLQEGINHSNQSNGKFNITCGALTRLWRFGTQDDSEEFVLPDVVQIQDALESIYNCEITISGNTVSLGNPDTRIDLGAVTKGHIAEKLRVYLINEGVKSAIINLGGNIATIGTKQYGSQFKVTIQKPFAENEYIASVFLKDKSIVTSGLYQRYAEIDGKLYHHIVDLSTGYPVENTLNSVSIIGMNTTNCDALSTLVFLMGYDEGKEYIENMNGYDAIFVDKEGNVSYTSGISESSRDEGKIYIELN